VQEEATTAETLAGNAFDHCEKLTEVKSCWQS